MTWLQPPSSSPCKSLEQRSVLKSSRNSVKFSFATLIDTADVACCIYQCSYMKKKKVDENDN